jgi:carboxyl-terminal processing protease
MKIIPVKKKFYIVTVLPLLFLSCVVDYDDPSYYDSLFDKEFEYCLAFLKANFLNRSKLPEKPYLCKTPDSLYKYVKDPGTRYLDSIDAYEFETSLATVYDTSLGIEIEALTKGALITYVYLNSPADVVNLQQGDTIIAVDDSSLANITLDKMFEYLGGQSDEEKKLKVIKKKSLIDEVIAVVIGRFAIPTVYIDKVNSSLAYLYIAAFLNNTEDNRTSTAEFDKAMQRIQSDSITKVIFDLRDNFIGYFDQSTAIADKILYVANEIIKTEEWEYSSGAVVNNTVTGTDSANYLSIEFNIVISDSTAGAAEILLSALKENLTSLQIYSDSINDSTNEKTLGFGSIQTFSKTPSDNFVTVTYGRTISISGDTIEGNGIQSNDTYSNEENMLKELTKKITSQEIDQNTLDRINSLREIHIHKIGKPICIK